MIDPTLSTGMGTFDPMESNRIKQDDFVPMVSSLFTDEIKMKLCDPIDSIGALVNR